MAFKNKNKIDLIRDVIRAYKAMQTVPELKTIKKPQGGIIGLLLFLLIELVGPEVVKQIIISFLTKNLDKGETSIKSSLKNLLSSDSSSKNSGISNILKSTGTGIKIPMKKIDKCGFLKINPLSKEGKDMIIPGSMDNHLQTSINNNPNNFNNYKGVLQTKYDDSDDTLLLKLDSSQNNKSFSSFLVSYIDSLNIINSRPLIKIVIDYMFGNLTPLLFSKTCIIDKLKSDKMIEKMKDDEETMDDDKIFDFTSQELKEIEEKAEQLSKGNNKVDLGCGFMDMTFNTEELNSIIDGLESTGPSSIQQMTNVIDSMENHVISNNLTTIQQKENSQTVKSGFLRGFLEQIEFVLIRQALLGPQMIMLFTLVDIFKGNLTLDVNGQVIDPSDSTTDDLKNRKSLVKNLTKQTKSIITKAIYDRFTKECNELKNSIMEKYFKDVISMYGKQLLSLLGIRERGIIN